VTGHVVGRRVPLGRPGYLFLGGILISTLGTTFGLLGATAAISLAGGATDGGLLAGIFLATALLATAVSAPYCPQLCARWGVRATFVGAQAINALAYAVAGVALLAGAPALPTLLISAPVFGVTTGTSLVVRPPISQAYQASDSTAHSYARMSVALGFAWGFGGLMLIALALCSALLTDRLELVAWVMVGVPLGIFRFVARALYVGSVADADRSESATANFATSDTVVMLMAPVGTVLFGLTLDGDAVCVALLVSGTCAIAWNVFALRTLRPTAPRSA